jgi:hypothetical protein
MAGIRAFRRNSQAQSPPYKPSYRTNHVFPPQRRINEDKTDTRVLLPFSHRHSIVY